MHNKRTHIEHVFTAVSDIYFHSSEKYGVTSKSVICIHTKGGKTCVIHYTHKKHTTSVLLEDSLLLVIFCLTHKRVCARTC